MPIYEYECDECGHHVEALQKFSDPPLTECEACHSHKLKKLISQSTFHLKGTGWYVTDYASKSSSRPAGRGRNGGGSTGKTDSSKGGNGAAGGSGKKDTSTSSGNKE